MSFTATIYNDSSSSAIVLKDEISNTEVEIYSFGAIVNKFQVKVGDKQQNVIDGFASPNAAAKEMVPSFKSAFLSPFTCRMNEGKYAFDTANYQIEKFFLPPHAIHGLVFDSIYSIDKIEQTESFASVQLSYTYNKEDAGYPFTYSIIQHWKLEKDNKLSVTSTIQHSNSFAIPYAQGWHPYFTLGTSVDDCTLQFTTDKQVEFDDTLLPTGTIINDNRFKDGALLEGIFLDNCFHLADDSQHTCTLKNDAISITIIPDNTYPYLQAYTPPHRNSIAIENLSGAPDCFNNGLGLLHIQPNTPTKFTTTYLVTPLI